MKTHHTQIRSFTLAALTLLAAGTLSQAATVTLTGDDTLSDNNNPSFSMSGHWSNGLAPSSGNTYYAGNYSIRTGSDSAGYTFAGDSLTLGDGVANASRLNIRTTGTITVNNLILNRGGVAVFFDGTATLAGNITLNDYGIISPSAAARTLKVNSAIGGTGVLRISTGNVTLAHARNTYSGGTYISPGSAGANLLVTADGALGTGDVRLSRDLGTPGTPLTLTLQGGTLNDYIADSASLIFDANVLTGGGSVSLSFTGIDIIGRISFDGGTTWGANGTYGGIGSGATYENALFSGTGLLNVGAVPEPSSATLALTAGGLVFVLFRLRRKNARA